MNSILQSHMEFPHLVLADAALAFAIDLVNGDVDEDREVIDVEYEDISNTNNKCSSAVASGNNTPLLG